MIDQLYTRYDSDRSGSFDKREMVKAMNELLIEYGVHMRINQHQAGRLIREIDSSGDGRVQKSEFFRMVKTILSGTDDY
jgi:Ca2+-binding EF-hand superfamily protein